jgi:hypothetical protein
VGRIKERLARTAADQELHRHLSRAGRELEQALDVCQRVARDRNPEAGTARRRAQEFLRRLQTALATVNEVGHLPDAEPEDIDRLPEETLSERYRAQRAARAEAAAVAAAKAAAAQKVEADGEEE